MTCPACESSTAQPLWRVGDRLFRTTERRFEVHQCAACRLLYLHPTPPTEELAAYYPTGYWSGPPDHHDDGRLRARLTELYRRLVLCDHVRFVRRVIAEQQARGLPVRLLDVGCGDGSFLEACNPPSAIGMDSSWGAVRAARARGLRMVRGTLTNTPLDVASFTIVTMFHFLEHVAPARPTLAAVRRLLPADGDLVVQVPNVASWQARLLGRYWSGLDVPRHLIDYSPQTLQDALEQGGFRTVRSTQFSLRDNTTAIANSLAPGLYPPARVARGANTSGLGAWLADLTYFGLTLASLPFALLESLFRRGGTVMVHARPA